jgi:hypothetical protein
MARFKPWRKFPLHLCLHIYIFHLRLLLAASESALEEFPGFLTEGRYSGYGYEIWRTLALPQSSLPMFRRD